MMNECPICKNNEVAVSYYSATDDIIYTCLICKDQKWSEKCHPDPDVARRLLEACKDAYAILGGFVQPDDDTGNKIYCDLAKIIVEAESQLGTPGPGENTAEYIKQPDDPCDVNEEIARTLLMKVKAKLIESQLRWGEEGAAHDVQVAIDMLDEAQSQLGEPKTIIDPRATRK